MKSVLISIQPKWCQLILLKEKLIEVRKSLPKLATPFRVYIYCTDGPENLCRASDGSFMLFRKSINLDPSEFSVFNKHVIAEFVCDDSYQFTEVPDTSVPQQTRYDITNEALEMAQLSYADLAFYGDGKPLWGWRISDLRVYDKPKHLSEFQRQCSEWKRSQFTSRCLSCPECYLDWMGADYECLSCGIRPIMRPPQSWCYIEGVKR